MKTLVLFAVVTLAITATDAVKVFVKDVVEYPGGGHALEPKMNLRDMSVTEPEVQKIKAKVIQHTTGANTYGDHVDGYNIDDNIVEPYEKTPEEEAESALPVKGEDNKEQEQIEDSNEQEKQQDQS